MSDRLNRSHLLIKPVLLASVLGLSAFGTAQAATTFHVRTDGGDASQCTGRADAPYSGSGTNQACAWKHPYYALPSSGAARIAGGDTLIIGSGEYMVGYGAPGATCASGDRTACSLGKIPSGPSSTAKTRILGKSASAMPKLWGAERTWSVLNLNGSSNVELGNLEITDKDDCVSAHGTASAACNRSSVPYGNWASIGLSASASNNVWVHDVNIHGMALQGINAGGLSNWTFERVKINANGWAGWDANVGSNSSNSGAMIMRDVEIAWNGCGQNPSTGAVVNCWGQKGGGYGDGLGTITTGGQWLIEDAFVHHNTSDGLDLLYMDGAPNTTVTIRRAYAVANAGNQIKTRGNATIENSVMVGSCAYFAGKYLMQAGDQCRASGNALSISVGSGDTVNVRHNTITGQGDGLIMTTEGDSSSKITIQNNALLGMPDYLAGVAGSDQLAVAHFAYNSGATVNFAGNLVWNVKNAQCPAGSICGQNPKLTNMTLASFDAAPLAGSPVIDKVAVLSGVATDFLAQPRPSGAKSDIGAIELQAGGTTPTPDPTPDPDPTPTPVCTRAKPAISLTGPTAAVAAGTRVNYTVRLNNKDSSACANTAFSLARTVPAGWSGTLTKTSVTLAPGASTTATLAVTSASGSSAGTRGIGIGAGSAVGSTHTASASSTYTVASANTPPPATTGLTGSVGTDKASYIGGQTVTMSARVLKSGLPVRGASVRFTAIKPNGVKIVMSATSGSDGFARRSFVSGTGPSSMGIYPLSAIATKDGTSVTAKSSFSVSKTGTSASAPTPVPAGLTEWVTTNKASYVGGQTVYISARVLKSGLPVRGATVRFTAIKPNGVKIVMSATSGSDGFARRSFVSGTGPSSMGIYPLSAIAIKDGASVIAKGSFKVIP